MSEISLDCLPTNKACKADDFRANVMTKRLTPNRIIKWKRMISMVMLDSTKVQDQILAQNPTETLSMHGDVSTDGAW